MQIDLVQNKRQFNQFYTFQAKLYEGIPEFVCPLISDIKSILQRKDKAEKVACFMASENGQIIGRIAAFYPVEDDKGGIGFFDCISSEQVAFSLFNAAVNWLEARGYKEIIGPVNFGQRDQFWGLLIQAEGPPLYQENFNPEYYRYFFESYGFNRIYRQFTYRIDLDNLDNTRLKVFHDRTMSQGVSYQFLNLLNPDKQVSDLVHVYNESWKHQSFFKPLSDSEVLKMFQSLKFILDPQLITLAYFKDQAIGIFASIPEINENLAPFKGKLNGLDKIILALRIKIKSPKSVKGLIFGIVPEMRNKGVDAGMIYFTFQNIRQNRKYRNFFLSWIGDFNPGMMKLMEKIGARIVKTHHTYMFRKN